MYKHFFPLDSCAKPFISILRTSQDITTFIVFYFYNPSPVIPAYDIKENCMLSKYFGDNLIYCGNIPAWQLTAKTLAVSMLIGTLRRRSSSTDCATEMSRNHVNHSC